MTAENIIHGLLSHGCSAVRAWMEEHPMAPLIRKMRIIIDKDVEISIPGAPKGLHEEFLTKQLGSIKSKERLGDPGRGPARSLAARRLPLRDRLRNRHAGRE